jgi:aspartyl-tRNA(Asn)/glutamyl-tRNA(Gln) amidotransferase subunit A
VILAGEKVQAAELSRLRDELRAHRAAVPSTLAGVDVVAMPTLPQDPVRLDAATDPFAQGACTFPFSLSGWPSLSLPCGFSDGGLPVGLLLSGPPLSEPTLLALAHAYEQATPWHERHPPSLPA